MRSYAYDELQFLQRFVCTLRGCSGCSAAVDVITNDMSWTLDIIKQTKQQRNSANS